MARVLIVSRTRMANGYVCVGGVDIDNRLSLRLLSQNGGHESASECPYEIWDIWDIDYYLSHRRPNPHTEDANVTRREKTKNVDPQNSSVEKLASALEKYNIPIFHGSLFSLFDGKLKLNDSDKLYISKDDVPDYSTCFWINDKRLLGYESRGHQKYRYNNMTNVFDKPNADKLACMLRRENGLMKLNQYGYTISYVGEAEPLDTIEAGSLIRLSLAHWWAPEDSDDEERCYLQLSGCLIEGKTNGESNASNNEDSLIPIIEKQEQNPEWFEEYERELDNLLTEKARVEEQITALRSQIQQQMEEREIDKLTSSKFQVNYSPAKTAMQFDRKAFKKENEELYSLYCVPKQKEASIVIRKKKRDVEE